MAATDARPVPRKNAAFRFYFAIRKNDGTLITTWAGQDSEVSLDGAAFSDCTNEATEIGSSGCGYIDLTAAEMNADSVVLKVTVTNTSALPLVFTFFPEESGDYRSDVVMISGDATAADNAESFFDGTGYAGTNNVIPTVTTVTTVNGLAANTVTASALAADAVTEIQSGLATAAALTIVDDFLDTEIAAIKAKTDNLPADPADASDIAASFSALNTKVDTIDDFLDTEIAAIKAKTDNLPTDPADQSAVEAAITAATSPLATAASLATVAGYLDTEIAAILADTNELQTDWANGGRLDLILDVIELWTKRNAVLVTGLLTGSGTNTEVYTISALGITATCTTDSSGNRSAVVWS